MAVVKVVAFGLACVVVSALTGCQGDDGGVPQGQAGAAAAGAGGMLPGGNGGFGGVLPAGGTGAGGAATAAGVPCDVAQIVSANCTFCHADPPRFTARMPLMKLEDFQAPSPSMPARKVFEVVPERINATQISLRMPPASRNALMPADLQTLNAWVQG